MSVLLTKNAIRSQVRAAKKLLITSEIDTYTQRVFEQIEKSEPFIKATYVFVYWSLSDEVPTHHFIMKWYQEKEIYLPVMVDGDLELRKFEGLSSLVREPLFGVDEPTGMKLEDESLISFAIIPGIAFDNLLNRLGRGRGFYDRVLKRLQSAHKVGLAFPCQMVECIPVEPHDVRMDEVIAFSTLC
jgi:5-formyltetrahydrofolate cyclo-ligase